MAARRGRLSDVTAPLAVIKLMSLSPSEFAATAAQLGPSHAAAEGGRFLIPTGGGHVEIAYTAQPPVQLGRLLHLPRGEVTVTFTNVGEDDRARFLKLFDRTFQRGGG